MQCATALHAHAKLEFPTIRPLMNKLYGVVHFPIIQRKFRRIGIKLFKRLTNSSQHPSDNLLLLFTSRCLRNLNIHNTGVSCLQKFNDKLLNSVISNLIRYRQLICLLNIVQKNDPFTKILSDRREHSVVKTACSR
ncbi:hypothetical protein WT11_30025 [Burkholderia stagnalis]|nr:hypothetical protein WT11_30025 [Burkholderia stagnalis]